MKFSNEQLEAISIEKLGQDACIVAGPGSGKTTVLVERFRQLVTHAHIPSSRILAITFTEKAASNMREKLSRELGEALETANVSTVHGFCYRLIREHAIEAGVDPGAQILEEGKGVLLRQRALERALDDLLRENPVAAKSLMRGLCADAGKLAEVYDAIRSAGVAVGKLREYTAAPANGAREEIDALMGQVPGLSLRPDQRAKLDSLHQWHRVLRSCQDLRAHLQTEPFVLTQVRNPGLSAIVKRIRELAKIMLSEQVTAEHAQDRVALIAVLERFDTLYTQEKRKRGWLDFSDLEFYAVRLLETHPHIRTKLREHFLQILMDEFQDTNGQQKRLLELLRAPDRFYAVGDINQSIFGFRYSSPEVFREYRDRVLEAGKHHVDLVENWRSRPEILMAVETVLQGRAGLEPRRLVATKTLTKKRDPSVEVIAVEAGEGNGTEYEAAWVAERICELRVKLRAEFRDMAVLVRNSSVFEEFATAFEKRGVPYEQSRKRGFLESREARDLTHLLRVISNPRDEMSLAVVLRSPFVELSDEGLLRLETTSQYNLAEALSAANLVEFEERDGARLGHFRERLAEWRAAHPHIAIDRLLMRAMDACGYPYGPGVDKFLAMARSADSPLQEFVEELEQLREVDTGEPETPLDTGRDAVRMMTAHSAKGLEFPIVFVASMSKGTRTTSPPFSFTPEIGLGAKWRIHEDDEGQDDAFHTANLAVISEREKHESSRLLYVAMTRAEEHLVLSYSKETQMHWAGCVREFLVKPHAIPFENPTEVQVSHPDGRTFAVRVLQTRQMPHPEQSSFPFESGETARELPRPVLREQYDSAVTVTALSTFADCPRKYYLAHWLGWEQQRPARLVERGEESGAAQVPASELGRDVHRLLAGELVETSDDAKLLARTFLEHELGARAARAKRVEREWSFLVAVNDVVVSGQIDLWFVEQDAIVLVDYKTNAEVDAGAYETQVHLYALALERATGLRVREAYLHFLRPNELVRVAADTGAAEFAVAQLAGAQERGEFPLRVAERCRRCAFYKGMCPAGRDTVNVEPLPN